MNSIVNSAVGHSRAWCAPVSRKAGLPMFWATLALTSTP